MLSSGFFCLPLFVNFLTYCSQETTTSCGCFQTLKSSDSLPRKKPAPEGSRCRYLLEIITFYFLKNTPSIADVEPHTLVKLRLSLQSVEISQLQGLMISGWNVEFLGIPSKQEYRKYFTGSIPKMQARLSGIQDSPPCPVFLVIPEHGATGLVCF